MVVKKRKKVNSSSDADNKNKDTIIIHTQKSGKSVWKDAFLVKHYKRLSDTEKQAVLDACTDFWRKEQYILFIDRNRIFVIKIHCLHTGYLQSLNMHSTDCIKLFVASATCTFLLYTWNVDFVIAASTHESTKVKLDEHKLTNSSKISGVMRLYFILAICCIQ